GGGEAESVGAERHAPDVAGMPLEGEGLLAGFGVPQLYLPTVGGGEPRAVGAERHHRDTGGPLEGEVPRGDLSLPVVPFKPSAIDASLVGRKLLVEPLLQECAVVVPVTLNEIHADIVQTLLGQFGLLLRQLGLLPFLGLGLAGLLLAVEGVLASLE